MRIEEIAGFLDAHLRVREVPDHPNALNGLQVERSGEVERVAFAVDAAEVTIEEAIRRDAHLLVVHHGLFWGGVEPVVGRQYRRFRAMLGANMGLYSCHLPLDVHPEHGNNAVLARELGVAIEGTFGEYRGIEIGVWGRLEIRREALAARLDDLLSSRIRLIPGGPERVERIGIITGSGGGQIQAARQAGLDAYITGEANHHAYFDAMEEGINVYLAGHYATEVGGVKALAAFVRERLGLETFFIDHPTGL